ncbi:unnamed protein product [Arctia plantaginis]|uniref:Uncharacterized protein n=1 Tax=Arctia plantaginis TaxID=874455 RepID=A0A8S1B3U2_ARCPL|nr:unnamed protein product [Arctia plantaginis]
MAVASDGGGDPRACEAAWLAPRPAAPAHARTNPPSTAYITLNERPQSTIDFPVKKWFNSSTRIFWVVCSLGWASYISAFLFKLANNISI